MLLISCHDWGMGGKTPRGVSSQARRSSPSEFFNSSNPKRPHALHLDGNINVNACSDEAYAPDPQDHLPLPARDTQRSAGSSSRSACQEGRI